MPAHAVTKAYEDLAGTVVESDSDINDYKPQLLSKSVVQPPFDMRSEIVHSLILVS